MLTQRVDHLALSNGHNLELLRAVVTVNNRQRLLPLYFLKEQFGQLMGLHVGILGLTFKPHTDDLREAPAIELVQHLVEQGAVVKAFDPSLNPGDIDRLGHDVEIVADPVDCAAGSQALILMTEWPEIVNAPWPEMGRRSAPPHLVFDGRNALDPALITACGFRYRGIGRTRPAETASNQECHP